MKFLMMLFPLIFSLTASAGILGYSDTTSLGLFDKVKCSTGLTCSRSNGYLLMTSVGAPTSFTFSTNGELITNATDDTLSVQSDDNDTILQVLGFEAKDAILQLWADQGDDAADKYSIKVDATNDALTIASGGGVADVKITGFEANAAYITLQADESDDNGDDWRISNNTSNTLGFYNDTSGSMVAKITIDTNGNIGGNAGTAAGSITGFVRAMQTASNGQTLNFQQCGSVFINAGAATINLPEASTAIGCVFTFVVANATTFGLNPDDNDIIYGLTNANGDSITNATIGSNVTLVAINSSTWVKVSMEVGTWTDAN